MDEARLRGLVARHFPELVVEIPGTGSSLKSLAYALRDLLSRRGRLQELSLVLVARKNERGFRNLFAGAALVGPAATLVWHLLVPEPQPLLAVEAASWLPMSPIPSSYRPEDAPSTITKRQRSRPEARNRRHSVQAAEEPVAIHREESDSTMPPSKEANSGTASCKAGRCRLEPAPGELLDFNVVCLDGDWGPIRCTPHGEPRDRMRKLYCKASSSHDEPLDGVMTWRRCDAVR